ncbi:MAG: DUF4168 domain-containing protein [Oscillatoriales cyanobacterium]|nr:MAG: DUF4168 domain-containing protein [Oscillatoriales cyanobacterium]
MVSPIQPLSRQWSRRLLTTIGKWVAIALAIWNLGSAPAIALTSELPSPAVEVAPAPRSPDASAVPAEKVTQFVHAYLQVLTLLDRRESELRQAETETEASRLEQEIELEAFGAIEQAGLKPQEYIQLLGLANSDPEFGERVAARLQELETEIQP